MTDFARAIQLSDLSARSRIARFGLRGQEEWHQTALPLAEACGHRGTGRTPQRRLFGPGWATVCARCGREV